MLVDLEKDKQKPTSKVFDKMVRVYKRSESILLLATPPKTEPLPKDYRTVAGLTARLSPSTRLAIRQTQELQKYVSGLADDALENRFSRLPTASVNQSPDNLAQQFREFFDVSLNDQLSWSKAGTFPNWRQLIESHGLLVLLKKMPWKDCRGFSLLSEGTIPAIVVNSEDVEVARSFTLFHELAHLALRRAGICVFAPSTQVEKWCNRFAAEFLVPSPSFVEYVRDIKPDADRTYDWPMAALQNMSNYYRVSRSVIALRLQELGLAIPDYYDQHRSELTSFDQRPKREEPIKIKKKPGWKEKQKLKEVGVRTASVILDAWKHRIADASEAADILNLSLSELHGLEKQTEAQRVRNVS